MTTLTKLRGAAFVGAGMALGLGLALPAAEAHPPRQNDWNDEETFVPCEDTEALIEAIEEGNDNPEERWKIVLEEGCTYTIEEPYDEQNGLPPITGDISISVEEDEDDDEDGDYPKDRRGVRGDKRDKGDRDDDDPDNAKIVRSETAEEEFRIFRVEEDGELTLKHITVAGGLFASGAGIDNFGTLTLKHSKLKDNEALGPGGGLYNGGEATLKKSRVVENTADQGGGIYNDGFGTLKLVRSKVAENTALIEGGGIFNEGEVINVRSKIVDNEPDNCAGPEPVPGCVD
jgi:hypothetical protein